MTRRWIVAAGIAAAAAAAFVVFRPRPAPPNLVLISIDTLRADRVSCYGCETPTTPVLDRFADGAAVFTDTIVQSPWTLPSHMSLFTSLYPSTHKVGAASRTLDPAVVTLPLLLREAGYATAAFVDAAFLSSRYGFSRGFDLYENAKGRGIETVLPRVESWLKTARREPFFLFVHVFDCHCPYTPPDDVARRFSPDYDGDLDLSGRCGLSGFEDADLDEDDVRYISQQYDGEVYAVDRGLSRLLGLLESLGLFENTVVVVTSDHGEEFMEHGRIGHTRSLYRELLQVPLIVRPAGGGTGRKIDRTVRG
ncbi:MAG TPA: sulfatase, partial [bacterium]|nr:sulfatase [bacterium]